MIMKNVGILKLGYVFFIMFAICSFSYANSGNPLIKNNLIFNNYQYQKINHAIRFDNRLPLGGSKLTYGFRFGEYISNIQFDGHTGIVPMDTLHEMYNKNGFSFGGLFNYQIDNRFSLQTEINYEQKGAKYNGDYFFSLYGITYPNEIKSTLYLNYLTIPLLVKVSFGRLAKVYIATGPYFGILTKARQKSVIGYQIDVLGIIEDSTMVFDDNMNDRYQNDLGLVFNGGLQIPVMQGVHGTAGSFFIEFRYNYGLRDIFEDIEIKENTVIGPIYHKYQENIRTRTYGLNIGLQFSF